MESGRKELGILVTTWKGEGGLSTVSETPEMICWFARVIALSLRSSENENGKVRTRWLRYRKTRRAAPFTAVRVGEPSHPGKLSTTWLSHSGTLRKHIQRFHDWLHPVFLCGVSLMRTLWSRADEADDVAFDPAWHGDWTEESQKRLAQKSSPFGIRTFGSSA